MVSTFSAGRAVIDENVSLFFPIALGRLEIELRKPVKALSFYKLSALDSGNLDSQGGAVLLDERDVYTIEGQSLEGETKDNDPLTGPLQVLSLDQRIIDTNALMEPFSDNKRFLEFLSLGNHLPSAAREQMENQALERLETRLFEMLNKKEIQPVSGYSTIQDLYNRSDVVEALRRYVSPESAQALSEYALRTQTHTPEGQSQP
jgi:hypothetical protein